MTRTEYLSKVFSRALLISLVIVATILFAGCAPVVNIYTEDGLPSCFYVTLSTEPGPGRALACKVDYPSRGRPKDGVGVMREAQ